MDTKKAVFDTSKSDEIVIGIDQSFTCTGVVVMVGGEMVHWETIKVPGKNTDSLATVGRAKEVSRLLMEVIERYSPDQVVLEGLSFGSRTNATRDLAQLQAIIISELFDYGVKPSIIPPTTLKKLASGSGTASKDEMYGALPADVQGVFGEVPKTKGRFDLSDAYHLAKTATNR